MDGQWPQQNSDVHAELNLATRSPAEYNSLMLQDLGDVFDGRLGVGANNSMANTGEASAAAADEDNNGGETRGDKRTAARSSNNRRDKEQTAQLEAAFAELPHPDEKQREELAKRLGMTRLQVKFWFQNRRSAKKTQDQRQELKELQELKEALQAERLALRAALVNYTCQACGGPTPQETQQLLRSDNERLRDEIRRTTAFLSTLGINANGGAGMALATNQALPPPSHHASAILIDLAARALNEFCMLVSVGTPMWLPAAPDGEVELLNLQQYTDVMIPSIFGPYRRGFAVDGTRKAGDVMCAARNLVGVLMNAADLSGMFPGIVASASATQIVTPSASQHGMILLMDAELRVLSPFLPVRNIKFVRQCQEVQPGKWAVVDVSVDGILAVPSTCRASRLRPSGCLIEDRNGGYCKVTWIVNMEYEETNVLKLYRLLFRSGQALGAWRWLASLQRQCEYLAILHTYTVPAPGSTNDIISSGRKNIFELAHRMTRSFYKAMCGPWNQPWRSTHELRGDCGIGIERFKVVSHIVTSAAGSGTPMEQAGAVVLIAKASIWLPGIPAQQVFDYVCNGNSRGEWDSLANDAPVLQEGYFATGQLLGNAISVLRTIASDGTNGKLILQEACADTSCMVLAYAALDEQSMQHVMNSGDTTSLSLLPSGLVILPDGVSDKNKIGSFVSVMYQTQLNVQPSEKTPVEAVDSAGNLLCRVLRKIKVAVHANSFVNA